MSSMQTWGRVLICGGTDWTKLGKKTVIDEDRPDLPSPALLRSLAPLPIRSIHSSPSSSHFVCISAGGDAFVFGRNTHSSLGLPADVKEVSEHAPWRVQFGGVTPKWVDAATGRYHTLLVSTEGAVWSAGWNKEGQCGHSPDRPIIPSFTLVKFDEKIVKAEAGIGFSVLLSESGKVYTLGSAEHGQLGNGSTGERITTGNKTSFDLYSTPYRLASLPEITQIAAGQQHGAALSVDGTVYVWGYNGYCRLGLGDQKDVLKPKAVPQFTGATMICAGPSSTTVIDKQGMYWIAGKWKNTGEGSSGSPFSTFRVIQDIMGCKIVNLACGGVTHFLVVDNEADGKMVVAFGQAAGNSELGLGPSQPKSATKPTEHEPLSGLNVISFAAGMATTLFLVQPPSPDNPVPKASNDPDETDSKWDVLPRHPEEVPGAPEHCGRCGGDEGDLLECDKCATPSHLACLTPPLTAIPDGEWFCDRCRLSPGDPLKGYEGLAIRLGGGEKRRADNSHPDQDSKKARRE